MEQTKIDRINELTRLSGQRALTPAETAERQVLRQEYLAEWRRGTEAVLESTWIDDGKGHVRKLKRK